MEKEKTTNKRGRKPNKPREVVEPIYRNELHCTQNNQIIRAIKDPLNITESKLIRFCISQISQDDTELKNYTISINKLVKLLNLSKGHVYDDVKEISTNLMKKGVYFECGKDKDGNEKYRMYPWVSMISYADGELEIGLNGELINYLLFLKEQFTDYSLSEIILLPSDASVKMYELLASWKRKPFKESVDFESFGVKLKKNQIIYSMKFLRKYFNSENKYTQNRDFIKRVIELNTETLKEKVLFPVEYEAVKQGKEIVAIVFTIGRGQYTE